MIEERHTGAEVFWVVGVNTDVGKTTMASALIRFLNKAGRKAVGFKPHAGVGFVDQIDFIAKHYPNTDARIFGSDALELARSSPLTDESMVEIIAPSYRIALPYDRLPFLARVGAKRLGNRRFFRMNGADEFIQRPDVRRLVDLFDIPFVEAKSISGRTGLSYIDLLLPEERTKSLNYLLGLGADATVFEGAGFNLPVWSGSPPANHILVVYGMWIALYPNVNFQFDVGNKVVSIRAFQERVKQSNYKPTIVNNYFIESEHRDHIADKIIAKLVQESKLL